MEEGRDVKRSLMKREKYRAKNGSLQNASTGSKEATFVILKTSQVRLSERTNPTSKARREASQISLWKRVRARQG